MLNLVEHDLGGARKTVKQKQELFRNSVTTIFHFSVIKTQIMLCELEGNVLLEPAAAMNQMNVLNCFINVDTSMKTCKKLIESSHDVM